jgi:hypothetical protein
VLPTALPSAHRTSPGRSIQQEPPPQRMPLPAALLVTALATAAQPPSLHRVGNKLLDRDTGKPVVLKGMAMMGGEYSCVHGQGVFAGPANETVVDGMVAWGINAIRLPMNEDCWLGQHGVDPRVSGPAYQSRFVQFVELLLSRGFVVVLDLHWTNSTGGLARGQDLFLSSSSPKFWASVASHPALRSRPGVVFELFNEPHDAPGGTAKLTPECFLNGQGCPHAAVAAGDGSNGCTAALQQLCGSARRASIGSCWVCEDAHQSTLKPVCSDADLVDFCTGGGGSTGFSGYNQAVQAVRNTANANNLVLFAGKQWNFDLGWLLAHFPTDPLQNCAAAYVPAHPYELCATVQLRNTQCATVQLAPV